MKNKINIFKLGSIIFTCAILGLSIGTILVPKLIESKENEVTTIVTPKQKVVSVSTLSDLQTNLADTSVTEIVITSCINITSETTLEGNNKVVRATTTGLNASGVVQSGSAYYIFQIDSGSTVTINNLTIMGGSASAICNYGTLYMTNVSITRSGKSTSGGGGIYNKSGTCVLKNCSIYRNIARYGGGFFSIGGTIVMDGCSLSENRSLATNGGGGACEVNSSGKLYINNSVISNNTSSEIGGAINNYGSSLYLMNTTVTGNATTGASTYGGGIGNNSGTLYAVNSIFANNFYVPSSGSATSTDIGRGGSNYLYNCLYGAFKSASLTGGSSNKTSISNAFASYQTSGILTGNGTMSTVKYSHPVLTSVDERLYAPLSSTSSATSGGITTYFDYTSLTSIKMGYGSTPSSFGGLTAPSSTKKVTTYIEGGTRSSGVIGASGSSNISFYTVKAGTVSNGSVSGITVYGDTYASGTRITVVATPNSNYYFVGWSNGTTIVSYAKEYTFKVTSDITLTAKFSTTENVVTKFIDDWAAMREAGNGSICNYIQDDTTMKPLLDRYDALTDANKALVDTTYDATYNDMDVTIGESITYVKSKRSEINTNKGLTTTSTSYDSLIFISISAITLLALSSYGVIRYKKRKEK